MRLCEIEGCESKHKAKGMCGKHYQRKQSGSSGVVRGVCGIGVCDRLHYAKSMCFLHYSRSLRGADLSAPVKVVRRVRSDKGIPRKEKEACRITQCGRDNYSLGLCVMHYGRHRAGTTVDREGNVPKGQWQKWRKADKDGYIHRRRNIDGKLESQYQHRHVMEQELGRPLARHENVHHINGIRDDNRPENLELWSVSQPPGQRVPDKLAWAKEFLEEYGYTVEPPTSD